MTITSLLGRTTCRIAFDQEEFRFGGVALLTISKFAGQRGDVHHALSTRKLTRLARCLACGGGIDNLLDNRFRMARIFLQRSEEHTSELQSLMRTSYAVFCLKKKNIRHYNTSKGPLIH